MGNFPITVTTELDELDTPSGANVSLREAVRDAAATGEFRTIVFDSSLDGKTIVLGGGELVISRDVRVSAKGLSGGLTISGDAQSRIFRVNSNSNLELECLRLVNGNCIGAASGVRGGAIQNYGSLSAKDCAFDNNFSGGNGGAISNERGGKAIIERSTFTNNSATFVGGGIHSIDRGTETRIANSTFFNNTSNGGGGGAINGTGFTSTRIHHCTVIENSAPNGVGGGLRTANSGTIDFFNSIITGNTAPTEPDLGGSNNTPLGTNLVGVPVDLRPLGDHGGKTQTLQSLAGGAALDAGTFFPLPLVDQRGIARLDLMPDIGAVEGAYAPPVVDNSARKRAISKKIRKLNGKFRKAKKKKQKRKIKSFKKQIRRLKRQLRAL